MKKIIAFVLSLGLAAGLAACGGKTPAPAPSQETETQQAESVAESTEEAGEETAETAVEEQQIIAVMFHAGKDDELMARKHYLDDYIASCFNVKFIYSDEIKDETDVQAFLANAAEFGAKGVLSFVTYDIPMEVEACESLEMYYMMGAETISEAEFEQVCDNPWFLGVVGPGEEEEYQTGVDMVEYFVEQGYGNDYFILTGGSPMGNEMHRQRLIGMLDALQEKYGVTFEQSSEELAGVTEITHMQIGDLTVCLAPGYVQIPDIGAMVTEEYEKDQMGCVLSVYDGSVLADVLHGANVGIVDCFSEANLNFFNSGELCFLAGKYGSIIGPSFAAMYNAVTGHADLLRDNGKAFQIHQGFWDCVDPEQYLQMYTLAESIEIQAYNYEDLYNVCAEYNPEATLADLKALAESYTYEDVVARRGMEEEQ